MANQITYQDNTGSRVKRINKKSNNLSKRIAKGIQTNPNNKSQLLLQSQMQLDLSIYGRELDIPTVERLSQ